MLRCRQRHAMRPPAPWERRHRPRQAGLSLMEALVAIVLLTLGFLAILGLQMHALANVQDSVRRTQAIRLVEDLSERLKTLPDAMGQAGNFALDWSSAVQTSGLDDCTAVQCTPSKLAKFESNRWLASVKESLPLGQANVFVVASDPRQLGVMLAWRANEKDAVDAMALLAPPSTGVAGVSCPAQRICHLQFVSLTQRCLPIDADNAYCATP